MCGAAAGVVFSAAGRRVASVVDLIYGRGITDVVCVIYIFICLLFIKIALERSSRGGTLDINEAPLVPSPESDDFSLCSAASRCVVC